MKFSTIAGVATAASLALAAGAATPAFADTLVHLNSASMSTAYTARIDFGSVHVTAYSNGITFNVTEVGSGDTYNLFAFCVDIFHHISLGTLDDYYLTSYESDPAAQIYDGMSTLSVAQTQHISTLATIGYNLKTFAPGADSTLRTAAIQAAIWDIEHPGSITLINPTASAGGGTYADYYNFYRNLGGGGAPFTTLTDATYLGDHETNHQGFIVGGPIPEPATWAIMLTGFFGAGAFLRRRRAARAA